MNGSYPSLIFLRIAALALLICCLPLSTQAATLCGVVRDTSTGQGVARAGVFLRLGSGAFTGFHAATDEDGRFCIDGIPAGIYDLEVRRDDYRVAYRRNVAVAEGSVGVDFVVGDAPAALLPPSPNPARFAVTLAFRLETPGPAQLTVHDVRGRLVYGWSSEDLNEGDHVQRWAFRDAPGRTVPPGLYFVRLSTGTYATTRTLIHLP